ncbi:MAG TPA: serine hydrolase domain-containing protein [Nocardioidaceae bacterium]|nr:serine hydrolase domain-containing protein [Nocardioidaceae bacterium]
MSAVTELASRRLRAALAREQSAARMPSLVSGLVRDGELVWTGVHGNHVGPSDPGGPSTQTQYRIGSITKTMTAVLVMQLRDEGRLELADRLDKHLPEVGYGDRTIRRLLSHSSGMQSEPAGSWWERSPGVSWKDLAAGVDDGAAPFPPGATYHYTNLAYAMLGELVARLRGEPWWEQVEQRILHPLGMSRTSYLAEPPAATGYSVHHFAGTLTEEPAQDTGAMAPAGQVWSTVDDLATYASFLIDGHDDVLASSTLAEMRTPQAGSLSGGMSGGFGLGLRLLAGGSGTLAGHTGSMPGFLAGLFVDPVRRTGAVCLANGTAGLRCEGLPADLLDELERCEPTVAPAWTPTAHVPPRVGEVLGLWHWGNTAYAFSFQGGELVVTSLATGDVALRFRMRDDGTMVGTSGYHHGETLRVVRNPDGSINHLVCATFVYTRVPYDPAAPIPGGVPDR